MMLRLPSLVAVVSLSLLSSAAQAKGSGSYRHLLSVSDGVSHPSYSALVGDQNPAGLAYIHGAQLHVDGQSATTGLSSPDLGADLLFGAPGWGGGVGVDWLTDGGTDGGDGMIANYGLAGYIQGIQTAIGVSGSSGISNASGTSLDLGILIGPYQTVTFGLAAYGITGGIDSLGAGVDLALGRGFSLVTDVITDTGFDDFRFKPGIWVGNLQASLTVSYGVGDGAGSDDFSVGGQVLVGRRFNWQIYYQQFNKLYTGVSFSL